MLAQAQGAEGFEGADAGRVEDRTFSLQILPVAVQVGELAVDHKSNTATHQHAGISQIASQKHVKVSDYAPSAPSSCVGE